MKDVFAALGAASSSNHQSLAVEPFARSAYGRHDLSPLSGFYSCERCSHCPLVDYLGPSFVRDSKNCPAVGNSHVRFGADLILPFLTVSLVETQVLPQKAPIVGAVFGAQAQQVSGSGPKVPKQ